MSIREVKLFQQVTVIPTVIPVIPVTTTPCKNTYINQDYEDMTGEDVPCYYKKENGLQGEILYACTNCGVVPTSNHRRYVIRLGKVHLACSAECVKAIKNKKEK